MKKLISCLLAVLLVCSVMSMNVFADTTSNIVGNRPTGGNGTDVNVGVNQDGQFNPGEGSYDINVNFGQTTTQPGVDTDGDGKDDVIGGEAGSTIIHKYAVDITYGDFLLDLNDIPLDGTLPGDGNGNGTVEENETIDGPFYMVWDVNTYKYVLCGKVGDKYVPVDIENADDGVKNEETGAIEGENGVADILETPYQLPGTVKVTNHSDLSVFTTLTLNDQHNDIAWKITAVKNNGKKEAVVNNLTATEEITKATAETIVGDTVTPGSATNGSTYYFTATPDVDEGWLGVIGNLLNTTTTKIGSITVTIAKNA